MRQRPVPKFFFGENELRGEFVYISGDAANHIVNALRHRVGDRVTLGDGRGIDYAAVLRSVASRGKTLVAVLEILGSYVCETEPPVLIRLFQSLIKWDNLDFAIMKAVEAGAFEIVPVAAKRSIYKAGDAARKAERLRKIARSAAEQTMRGIIPHVMAAVSFDEALQGCGEHIVYACGESRACLSDRTKEALSNPGTSISLWIGPEGGFTAGEKEQLQKKGASPLWLGPRVLRSETAAIAALVTLLGFSSEHRFGGYA